MKLRIKHMLDRAGGTGVGRVNNTRPAFTLLEILIAVAALGVIAVGVAAIFAATGKTISAGKRVSTFNAYAALIEQRLRADINSMTRDGFLVIRNEYATNHNNTIVPVALFDGDEHARERRIDEILFFAKGEFQSAATPLDGSTIARSRAARIYLGHGQRRPNPGYLPGDHYFTPEVDDETVSTTRPENYLLGDDYVFNPNWYAADWTLLRQVTLLCPPSTSFVNAPINPHPGLPTNDNTWRDSETQIALQPAAASIFRALAAHPFPATTTPAPQPVRGNLRPKPASGIVDIAACDLALVNSIYMTANVFPGNQVTDDFYNPLQNGSSASQAGNKGVDNILPLYTAPISDTRALDRIHSWMDDAFPANSMGASPAERARVRYEPSPPNFVGVINDSGLTPIQQAYRTRDQAMLSASNFLPRCTEFIVEWSFGKTLANTPVANPNAGKLIWHGMRRTVDGDVVADPYNSNDPNYRIYTPYRKVNGTIDSTTALVTTDLIHRIPSANVGTPVTSYFGGVDPTFNPDTNGDGILDDPNDSATPTTPWAWPKLIRVTLSLADPNDPSIERTFQFVFQVPDRDGV